MRGPRSIASTHILVSNKASWRMTESKAEVGNTQDEPDASCNDRKQRNAFKDGEM